MDFKKWEPFYHQILNDFNYDPVLDMEAAKVLNEISGGMEICDEPCLKDRLGHVVDIFGHAPDLERSLGEFEPENVIIAAGSATGTLIEHGIMPDIIFSDLDGDVNAEIEASRKGAIAVILAHGDNVQLLRRFVPQFRGTIVPTCQCMPFGILKNYGGFTDGDRAVVTARHFGVRIIRLHGFDFDSPRTKAGGDIIIKKKKLGWAKRIIFELNTPEVQLIQSSFNSTNW